MKKIISLLLVLLLFCSLFSCQEASAPKEANAFRARYYLSNSLEKFYNGYIISCFEMSENYFIIHSFSEYNSTGMLEESVLLINKSDITFMEKEDKTHSFEKKSKNELVKLLLEDINSQEEIVKIYDTHIVYKNEYDVFEYHGVTPFSSSENQRNLYLQVSLQTKQAP